ncbi:type II toxin-antitoxin system RelE family toxin [Corynebacterium hylobatis]|uniref:type II toxin-antitoxin system RelE family toxin n=1 Tax=Corynebacterium hylobatis TaxID=1859290 RepID=UPI001F499714|nr:hypothetical protein [Corynebacterium hylobatis]
MISDDVNDGELIILVLHLGHRRDIYRTRCPWPQVGSKKTCHMMVVRCWNLRAEAGFSARR